MYVRVVHGREEEKNTFEVQKLSVKTVELNQCESEMNELKMGDKLVRGIFVQTLYGLMLHGFKLKY